VQFHPEKPLAEWDPALAIPHDAQAVLLSQSLANFFVAEARRSTRTPAAGGYTEVGKYL
jgi:gamma-glutamyl hydrolase